jgi:hypothetical protein
VQVAEHAVANKIAKEPAFAWWVGSVLRRRDRIIKKVSSRYWSRTHKFGVQLPKSWDEALKIDRETGTDFWQKAIEKEMATVKIAFKFDDKDKTPVGYKKIDCHMIYDVKMDLTRKARFVAGGHQTAPSKESTYSSVVSRDSVRIAFLIAALNDLEIAACDIQGAYLNAETTEKVYTIAGPEFGADSGRPAVIVRALYGLRVLHPAKQTRMFGSARHLSQTGPSTTSTFSRTVRRNALCVSLDPMKTVRGLEEMHTPKKRSVGEPTTYLGAQVKKWTIEGSDNPDKPRWAMSSEKYVKAALRDVETELDRVHKRLPSKAPTPLTSGYHAELDATPELDARRASYYQGQIGVLRWVVELGRMDIMVPISILASQLANPREGHLEQVFHLYSYLKSHDRSTNGI